MSYVMRIFWLITLLFFAAGCSGYQVACYTRTEGSLEPAQDAWEICDLKPGDKVRVTLEGGEQTDGVVQIISSTEIVLDAKGNNPQSRGYSIDQVQSIMKSSSGSKSKSLKSMRMTINPGDDVRLVLVDGIQVRGKVMTISSKEIVLELEDQSAPFQVYSSDQIYSIESESSGGGNSDVTPLLIVGGIILIAGAVILASEMSELNNMFEQ